jgi:hypothetical protein
MIRMLRIFQDWRRCPAPGTRLGENRSRAGVRRAQQRARGQALQKYAAAYVVIVVHRARFRGIRFRYKNRYR